MKLYSIAVMLIWIAVAVGCSGAPANPVQPIDKPSNTTESAPVDSQRQLWGMWDIRIDLETLSATVMPDRDVENHFNVLPFLQPPQCSDCLKLYFNSFNETTRILDVDVTLRNKFAVSGYDVRGTLFTNVLGHMLKNEDAWTPMFDVPGGDTINPFKAFAKDDPLRKFPGLAKFTENYRIWVPDPPKYALLKYAVDASYPTNCTEPYAIGNFTQAEITADVGSHGEVSVTVSDWQDDVDSVSLQASVITGEDSTPMTHQSGNIWSVDLTNNMGAAVGDYKVGIAATSTGSGTTGLYYFTTLTISKSTVKKGWARTWGGSNEDYGYGVAVDGSGNVYVTGYFQETVDLDPSEAGTDNHTSNGYHDIFLSKFDSLGNFVWARTWGDYQSDLGYGVAVDGSGNVFVTGMFFGTVDFDPGSGVDEHSVNGDWWDIFLSKFDSSGNFVWARTWGGAGAGDHGKSVAVDGYGGVYVTGGFIGTGDFDPGSDVDIHTSIGGWDAFLSKFNSSGNFNWARTWGGTSSEEGYKVATDEPGDPYVTGYYEGVVDFNPGSGIDEQTSNGGIDVFLSKFGSAGVFQWARTWGAGGGDSGDSVATDGSGSVFVSGYYSNTVDFDPGSGEDYHTSFAGDIFLSKLDSTGSFQWARTWGGSGNDVSGGVAVEGSGNVLITGGFGGTVDFDPGSDVENHTTNGQFDVFISKFDPSGNFLWVSTWGGVDGECASGFAVEGSGNMLVTGWFYGAPDFDPGSDVDSHTSNGINDIYVSKFDPNGNW